MIMGNPKGVKRDFDQLEERRFRAGKLFDEGFSKAHVARELGVSFASARRWFQAWQENGAGSLKKAGRAGRKPKLTESQMDQLKAKLVESSLTDPNSGHRYTTERVDLLIEQLTGVHYHPEHVGRILKRLGLGWYGRPRRSRNGLAQESGGASEQPAETIKSSTQSAIHPTQTEGPMAALR
jgi:transposase